MLNKMLNYNKLRFAVYNNFLKTLMSVHYHVRVNILGYDHQGIIFFIISYLNKK